MDRKENLKPAARRGLSKVLFLVLVLALALSLGVGSARASASTFTTNVSVDTELYVFVPCAAGGTGEVVYLTGPLHILFVTTIDNRGVFHTVYHFQPQGVSGTGLTTGDAYHATGETAGTFNGLVGYTQTDVNNFKIIGAGPNNNFLVHENFHVTVKPDGTLTTFVDNFSAECR